MGLIMKPLESISRFELAEIERRLDKGYNPHDISRFELAELKAKINRR